MTTVLTFLAAAGLALVHLFARRLRFLEGVPRSVWLSFAGGVSVAYVFVHLLPDLGEHQEAVSAASAPGFLERHVYLMALTGLVLFYGLERAALLSRGKRGAGADAGSRVFWLHIGSFTVYNALIGYLITRRDIQSGSGLLLFVIAFGLHFLVNDSGLREHHKEAYDRVGRWLLAGAVLLGWAAGQLLDLPAAAVALIFAFLAGGVVLNVLKEELPEERESRFWSFALGAVLYTLLLLAL